jgi:hypothetical protein
VGIVGNLAGMIVFYWLSPVPTMQQRGTHRVCSRDLLLSYYLLQLCKSVVSKHWFGPPSTSLVFSESSLCLYALCCS